MHIWEWLSVDFDANQGWHLSLYLRRCLRLKRMQVQTWNLYWTDHNVCYLPFQLGTCKWYRDIFRGTPYSYAHQLSMASCPVVSAHLEILCGRAKILDQGPSRHFQAQLSSSSSQSKPLSSFCSIWYIKSVRLATDERAVAMESIWASTSSIPIAWSLQGESTHLGSWFEAFMQESTLKCHNQYRWSPYWDSALL